MYLHIRKICIALLERTQLVKYLNSSKKVLCCNQATL